MGTQSCFSTTKLYLLQSTSCTVHGVCSFLKDYLKRNIFVLKYVSMHTSLHHACGAVRRMLATWLVRSPARLLSSPQHLGTLGSCLRRSVSGFSSSSFVLFFVVKGISQCSLFNFCEADLFKRINKSTILYLIEWPAALCGRHSGFCLSITKSALSPWNEVAHIHNLYFFWI